jgi:hypothetical protein
MSYSLTGAPLRTVRLPVAALDAAARPVLPALLILAALLPEDLNVRPGGLLLTMPRIVLLASAPFLLTRFFQRRAAGSLRVCACDWIVGLTAIWMFLSVSVTQGLDRAMVGASVLILELGGSYLLMRVCLNGAGQVLVLARWMTILIAGNALLSILDVVTGQHILHDVTQSLTGYSKTWRFDYRDGILRSQGMQEHPILLGTVSACGAVLALLTMKGMHRIVLCGCCLIGVAASDSSAPIGAFVIACGLILYHRMTARYKWRWQTLMIAAGTMLTLLLSLHPRPFSFLLDHFTANPQDGYYRLLIWSLCGPLVLDSPLYGVGLESDFAARFEVAQTVDSVWLASAMNFGIPGALLILGILISACARPVAKPAQFRNELSGLGRALGIILFLYIYLGLTVDFWGCTWILMGVFAALRVHVSEAHRV